MTRTTFFSMTIAAVSIAMAIDAPICHAQSGAPEPPPSLNGMPCWVDDDGNFNPDAFPPPAPLCLNGAGEPIDQSCGPGDICPNPEHGPIPYYIPGDPGRNWHLPDPKTVDPCDFDEWFEENNPFLACLVPEAAACVTDWAQWYWDTFLNAEPCSDDALGGGTPNPGDSGQPDDETPGPGEGDPNANPCNRLLSRDPINLARGSKSEFNEDLRIALPGRDFVVQRHDTSDPAHTGAGLVGVLHLHRGELYEAANEFEWARKLMPGHPDPRLNLALTLERAGRIDEALSTYQTALEVYPGHMPTMQAIARLQLRHNRTDEQTHKLLREIALGGENDQWREWAKQQMIRLEGRDQSS